MRTLRFAKWLLVEHWPHKAKSLFIGLIAWQYAGWLSEYWYAETYRIVACTLVAVFVTELFPRIPWMGRRLLQFAAVVFFHVVILHFHAASPPKLEAFREFIPSLFQWLGGFFADFYLAMSPYIWYGLGAWLIYIGAIRWIEGRARILWLTIGTVLFFAGMDSFSVILFMNQVAIVIFSGLLLLLADHFSKFKQQHPGSWVYVAEYPGILIASVVALVFVIVLAGWISPNVRPLLTDPYTLWKHSMGEQVNLPGKSYSDDRAPRAYSSGYSRNDEHLGGGFAYDYTPIMSVNTDHRSYWKGETRSIYSGQGWIKAQDPDLAGWAAVEPGQKLQADRLDGDSKLQTKEIKQTFSMLKKENYPVLFGAYSLESLVSLNGDASEPDGEAGPEREKGDGSSASIGPGNAAWSAGLNELAWRGEEYPTTYTVVSQVPVIDEAALRTAPLELADPDRFRPYLQLPAELPDRVGRLTRDITGDASTAYDKVKRIETYLKETYPYTNEPDLTPKTSADFVDSFLFEIKQGYCDYFSTAMAVMVRTIGIPSRWVKGYTSGTNKDQEEIMYGAPDEYMDFDGPGEYVVRNADAHSWVEVYIQGWGWIPFEPTSGFVLPVVQPEQVDEIAPLDLSAESSVEEEAPNANRWPIVAGLSAALLALALIVWGLIRWKRLSSLFKWKPLRRRKAVDLNQLAILEFDRAIRYGARKGYVRNPGETARETAARWSGQNARIRPELMLSLSVFEAARYSREGISEQDLEQMVRALKSLREAM